MPPLPWGARHTLPNSPLTQDEYKHTYIGHPLPDFYLQNTCKFALPFAAWIAVLAMRTTQKDARVLTPLVSPTVRRTARDVRMAEQGIRSVTIPVEGSPVGEARSQSIWDPWCPPHMPQLGHNTPRHAVLWLGCIPGGRRDDRSLLTHRLTLSITSGAPSRQSQLWRCNQALK